jgi:hypothetical protein
MKPTALHRAIADFVVAFGERLRHEEQAPTSPGDGVVAGPLAAACAALCEAADGSVRLRVWGDLILCGDSLVVGQEQQWPGLCAVALQLAAVDVGTLDLAPDVLEPDLAAFARAVVLASAAGRPIATRSFGALAVGPRTMASTAGADSDPATLALALHRALTQRLQAATTAIDGSPHASIRRALLGISRAWPTAGPVFQALAACHPPERPSRAHYLASVSLELLGFALWMGLERRQAVVLALAGVLDGLARGEPDDVSGLAPLLARADLGPLGLDALVAAMDARRCRGGVTGGAAGNIVAVVSAYQGWQCQDEPRRAAPEAIALLDEHARPELDPSLSALFVAWKGPLPMGSLVSLNDGRRGLVIAFGTGERPRWRPLLALIADGRIAGQVALTDHPELDIHEVFSSSEAGIDLLTLTG